MALLMVLPQMHIASLQQMAEIVLPNSLQLPAVDAPTHEPTQLRMTVASVALSSQDKDCQRCSSSCHLCKSQNPADASCRFRSEMVPDRNVLETSHCSRQLEPRPLWHCPSGYRHSQNHASSTPTVRRADPECRSDRAPCIAYTCHSSNWGSKNSRSKL